MIKNLRSFEQVYFPVTMFIPCVISENYTDKSNVLNGLRLCLDHGLPFSHRTLTRDDIHSRGLVSNPLQILAVVDFRSFKDDRNKEDLVHGWQIGTDGDRLFDLFRSEAKVREVLVSSRKHKGTGRFFALSKTNLG